MAHNCASQGREVDGASSTWLQFQNCKPVLHRLSQTLRPALLTASPMPWRKWIPRYPLRSTKLIPHFMRPCLKPRKPSQSLLTDGQGARSWITMCLISGGYEVDFTVISRYRFVCRLKRNRDTGGHSVVVCCRLENVSSKKERVQR